MCAVKENVQDVVSNAPKPVCAIEKVAMMIALAVEGKHLTHQHGQEIKKTANAAGFQARSAGISL